MKTPGSSAPVLNRSLNRSAKPSKARYRMERDTIKNETGVTSEKTKVERGGNKREHAMNTTISCARPLQRKSKPVRLSRLG